MNWCKRFILFHGKRHPREMGAVEIEAFLTDLAVRGQVAASTQNQALSAILFLYQRILEIELPLLNAVRAKRPERVPVVLAPAEVRLVLDRMPGVYRTMAELMYGSGLRLLECCRLRIKDMDFMRQQIVVREGKGEKDRVVPLPRKLAPDLRQQIEVVKRLHEQDLAAGLGRVWLPYALALKYPEANRELGWQYLFPSSRLSEDPREGDERELAPEPPLTPTGKRERIEEERPAEAGAATEEAGWRKRHHVHENMVQKMV